MIIIPKDIGFFNCKFGFFYNFFTKFESILLVIVK